MRHWPQEPDLQTRNEDSDDVGIDQAPDLRFAFPQCLLRALALCYVCRSADERDELSIPGEIGCPDETTCLTIPSGSKTLYSSKLSTFSLTTLQISRLSCFRSSG